MADVAQNKAAAKQCLATADKYIKDSRFVDARNEVEKAKSLDPSNLYINAFIDRIDYFEKERKLEIGTKPIAVPEAKKTEPVKKDHEPKSAEPKPVVPTPTQSKTVVPPKPEPAVPPQPVVPPKPEPAVPPQPVAAPKPEPAVPPQPVASPTPEPPAPPQPVVPKKSEPVQAPPPVPKQPPVSAPIPKPAAPVPPPKPAAPPVPVQKQPAPPAAPEVPPVQAPKPVSPPAHVAAPKPVPPPPAPAPPVAKPVPVIPQERPVDIPQPVHSQHSPVVHSNGPIENLPNNESDIPPTPNIRNEQTEQSYSTAQLNEMKKQIELLSQALEQEKKAREDLKKSQVQQSVIQFRRAMEKAWENGAPAASVADDLRQLAMSLSISENVEKSIRREVKVEMYSRAVKEVVAKRQLLKSSSSTFEWLRKVYQLTIEEYLEYESKFLMDLVSNQYKGTLFQISSDQTTVSEITPKLKGMGYAVVSTPSPENALEKIEKLNPNVIVCETNFGPGSLSGIRFLHILRNSAKFNFIPFIFLTSLEDLLLIESSELKPNEGYVKKPVNIDDLSAKINEKLSWFKEYVSNLS